MHINDVLAQVIRDRWDSGRFHESDDPCPCPWKPLDFPWQPYKNHTLIQHVVDTPGELGILRVWFPPESSKNNHLHIHPISDRLITVLKGGGRFIAETPKGLVSVSLKVDDHIWMPRGILHSFYSGPEGLLLNSAHNPYVPTKDENYVIYPPEVEPCECLLGLQELKEKKL